MKRLGDHHRRLSLSPNRDRLQRSDPRLAVIGGAYPNPERIR